MAAKDNMKEEIETMRRHFGGLVALVKDLKGRVETLEKEKDQSDALEIKTNQGINEEVDNILKQQDAVDKAIAANKEAITEIDQEIKEIFKQRKYSDDEKRKKPIENAIDDTDHELSDHKKQRKCRYFNRGFCKYTKDVDSSILMEFVETTCKLKNVKMLNALKDILNNVNGSKVGEFADEALIVPICIQV